LDDFHTSRHIDLFKNTYLMLPLTSTGLPTRVRIGKIMVIIDLVGYLMRRYIPLDPDASSSEMGEVGKVMFDQEVPTMMEKSLMMMGLRANKNC
jgi:hypothetical protein